MPSSATLNASQYSAKRSRAVTGPKSSNPVRSRAVRSSSSRSNAAPCRGTWDLERLTRRTADHITADRVASFYAEDATFQVSWKTLHAGVSTSGDLGFTAGTYEDSNGAPADRTLPGLRNS